jgi:hypothetical protein
MYVRPLPGPGGKRQISTGGGVYPTWSRTKRELDGRFLQRGANRSFDLHPDGERFAIAPATQTPGGAKQDHVTFIVNFFDELRRIAPVTKR